LFPLYLGIHELVISLLPLGNPQAITSANPYFEDYDGVEAHHLPLAQETPSTVLVVYVKLTLPLKKCGIFRPSSFQPWVVSSDNASEPG